MKLPAATAGGNQPTNPIVLLREMQQQLETMRHELGNIMDLVAAREMNTIGRQVTPVSVEVVPSSTPGPTVVQRIEVTGFTRRYGHCECCDLHGCSDRDMGMLHALPCPDCRGAA